MSKLIFQGVSLAIAACLLAACGGATKPTPKEPYEPIANHTEPPKPIACSEPRPEMCTREYAPVCGTKLEAPVCKPGMACPAIVMIKKKTYSNSCTACSDPKVREYTKGECA